MLMRLLRLVGTGRSVTSKAKRSDLFYISSTQPMKPRRSWAVLPPTLQHIHPLLQALQLGSQLESVEL